MSRSETLFANAQKHIPGGVNSPVRAFKSVGGTPLFFKHAEGAYVTDEDNKRYVDYVGSWGPMILGHSHPDVLDAVRAQLEHGLSYGAPTAMETEMADLVCSIVPSMEMVRMVSSGTEATMSAIRLARGFTGRDNILKFEGCYHGHSDSLLVKAGSGALTQGVPSSAGVPADFAKHTLTTAFNDIEAVEKLLNEVGDTVACIIVEPVAGNMNCVPPAPGFLEGLRSLCDKHGAVLIFDEVMTGFRVALGGAQAHYGVTPDLSTFGKIIGGGMPVGCFGGKREIMQHIAPLGPVYQAGTLSGNPLATVDFVCPEDAIRLYLHDLELAPGAVGSVCLSVAGPVSGDEFRFTNNHWRLSRSAFCQALQVDNLLLVNDFSAMALGMTRLQPEDVREVCPGTADPARPAVVIGPGTGLGVGTLLNLGDEQWMALPGEGGHVDLPMSNPREVQLWQHIYNEIGHVSAETILSGSGLPRVYRAICAVDGHTPVLDSDRAITAAALDGDPVARQVLEQFSCWLGRVAGNNVLTVGGRGGVYIVGGVIPRFADIFLASGFAKSFADKGCMSDYLKGIPVWLVTAPYSGLIGAGVALQQAFG